MATSTLKSKIRKQICDSKHSMRDLINTVKINDYLNAVFQPDEESIIMYGVNVRLKDDADIMPFIYFHAGTKYSASSVAGNITYTAPDFINSNHIKDIYFSCKIKEQKQIGEVSIISGHDALEGNNVSNVERIEELLNQSGSFLIQNIEALGFKKDSYCYVWIAGEDFDPESGGEKTLSNILAISNKQPIIENLRTKQIQIEEFLFLLKSKYLIEVDRKRKLAAEKSAKAAIMSRNMSHNLGSHVMAYLKQKLGSVPAILNKENKVLSNLYLYDDNELSKTTKESVEMPFLVGLGRFIGYLQERQDYIATIATDYIPYGAPVNMKDAIYDELNPDLRHLRHNAYGSEKDQNLPFNVLLSYIAKSENLSRENMGYNKSNENSIIDQFTSKRDILFGYITYSKKGENIVEHTFGLSPNHCDSHDEALAEMRKMNFSLPGGLVGRQAVFSIVENLIRNAAKHGDTSNVTNLCFTFDVIDCEKLGSAKSEDEILNLEKRLCDAKWRTFYTYADDRNDLYLLTITDNLTYDSSIATSLQPGLTEDYINKSGSMTTANKGIKEIRISAAWLRGDTNERNYYRYDDKIDTPKHAPLVAIEVTSDNHLRYIVALKKNRLVAYIREGLSGQDLSLFNELNAMYPNEWVGFDTIEDALKESKNSYKYILVANEELYNKIRPLSSNRVRIWTPSNQQKMYINTPCRDSHGEEVPVEKKVLSVIYQIFTKIDPDNELIYIWDGKALESHTEADNYHKIHVFSGDKCSDEAKYAYRTHHSSEKDFSEYFKKKMKGEYPQIKAIDAITGDNSSDRLVRREPLNEEWYYSHLYALKKKVAIFDERLFRIVHNISNEDIFFSNNSEANKIYANLLNDSIALEEAKSALKNAYYLSMDDFRAIRKCDTKEEIISILQSYVTTVEFHEQEIVGNHMSIVYAEKGVDVFTIVQDKSKKNVFYIIGCSNYSATKDGKYLTSFKKIGTITASYNDKFEVHIEISESRKSYDYISIHQGLLDKIYEGFGIKKHNNVNDAYKKQVTAALYSHLMENDKTIGDYLPRFIIHSGRAKPTKDDMPQKQPFIQYAAIENGVKDCKFALVELLDYARYEKGSDDEDGNEKEE